MRSLIVWAAMGSVLAGCALVSGLDKVGVGGSNDGGSQGDGNNYGKDGDPQKDGEGPWDSGSGPDSGSKSKKVACGSTTCVFDVEQCCIGQNSMQGTCIAKGSSCGLNILGCTGPSNCDTNEVCCLSTIDAGVARSSCQSSCQGGDIVCDPQSPMCPGNDMCQKSFKVSLISTCN